MRFGRGGGFCVSHIFCIFQCTPIVAYFLHAVKGYLPKGVQPWLDSVDLLSGQKWQIEIPKAIASSDIIIICLSKGSVDKEGYLQKEIKFALDKALELPDEHIGLIPIRLEECQVPYSLQQYQWLNLFEKDAYLRLTKSLDARAKQMDCANVG